MGTPSYRLSLNVGRVHPSQLQPTLPIKNLIPVEVLCADSGLAYPR
jgi:hypothetical protein